MGVKNTMGFEMKANAVNQIPKGTEIFLENEPATYVCVVIKGRVLATSESAKILLPSGSFLGVFDSKNKGKQQKDIQQCSKEGIFIACMGLSGRAKKINEESIDYYLESIPGTLDRQTILELKANMMNKPHNGNYLK